MWWICNDNCITDFPQNVSVKELDCCYAPENRGRYFIRWLCPRFFRERYFRETNAPETRAVFHEMTRPSVYSLTLSPWRSLAVILPEYAKPVGQARSSATV